MEYVTKNGDTVEARGLTLKVELGEKTRNEIVSRAMAQVQDATETIERLTQALAEADAENDRLRELVNDMWICISRGTGWDCTACPLDGTRECDFEGRMITLGIEVE